MQEFSYSDRGLALTKSFEGLRSGGVSGLRGQLDDRLRSRRPHRFARSIHHARPKPKSCFGRIWQRPSPA